jgi:hypothetical protein
MNTSRLVRVRDKQGYGIYVGPGGRTREGVRVYTCRCREVGMQHDLSRFMVRSKVCSLWQRNDAVGSSTERSRGLYLLYTHRNF